jgi:glyoxylase-like metal-dependent hydrolase (beta-lactamase superfamily II)
MARIAALDWFSVEALGETTFAITDDAHWEQAHRYLFVGDDRAALVDTGTGIGKIRELVQTLVDLPIVVLTTHVHWDHIGGHGLFDERLVHSPDADWLRNGVPQPPESQRGNLTRQRSGRHLLLRSRSSAGSPIAGSQACFSTTIT